jgi:hypothetical protein
MKVIQLATPSNDNGMKKDNTTGQENEIILQQQQT